MIEICGQSLLGTSGCPNQTAVYVEYTADELDLAGVFCNECCATLRSGVDPDDFYPATNIKVTLYRDVASHYKLCEEVLAATLPDLSP